LITLVITLFGRHKGRYGSPRITDDLRALGWRVSVNTIAAIMAEQHLVARPRRRRRGSTRPDRSKRKAPDLLHRDFTPPARPNVAWVGDFATVCLFGWEEDADDIHRRMLERLRTELTT
jgi:putative transposase